MNSQDESQNNSSGGGTEETGHITEGADESITDEI